MNKAILFIYLIFIIFISQFALIKLQEDGGEAPGAGSGSESGGEGTKSGEDEGEEGTEEEEEEDSGENLSESDIKSIVTVLKQENLNIGVHLASIKITGESYIKDYYNSNEIIYQFSYADKQSGQSGNWQLPQVKISESCLSKLQDRYEPKKIVISKIFRKAQTSQNKLSGIKYLTDIIYYQFYAISETNINDIEEINKADFLQTCNEKVIYYLPIYANDSALKNKYISVIRQNPEDDVKSLRKYDIFDPEAKIYKDICATITYSSANENDDILDQDSFANYDITLNARRNYYFPGNTALCPKDFTYIGVDKNTFSSMCETDFKYYDGSDDDKKQNIHRDYTYFTADKKFKSGKKDKYFTMGVLKCIKLPFTKKGFKGNYGSILILLLIAIVIICYAILLLTGQYHLLSVLELLYNSNIKSMNYIKNAANNNNNNNNSAQMNNSNQVIPYDSKSNNNLGMSHQTVLSNGQLMPNNIIGNNYLYNPNINMDKVSISKKSNNKKKNEKKDSMDDIDEQENDFESEKGNEEKDKTKIYNDSKNDKNDVKILKVKNKNKDENKYKEKNKKKEIEEVKSDKISKKEEEENEDDDEEDENEESESNRSYNNNSYKKNEKDKTANKKSNPPKKKGSNQGGEEEEDEEEENTKKGKKRKSKNPIEISLNVKDLREMMFKDQLPKSENTKIIQKEKAKSKSKQKKKNKNNNNINNGSNINNSPQNGFPFPYLPPINMMPYGMPPFPYFNNGTSPQQNNDETHKLKKELEYQKELNERRDREMRREREDMQERERERQRQRDYDYERERRLREMERMYDNYGNKGMELGLERFEKIINKNKAGVKRGSALWNDDSNDILMKEREKFNQEQDKFNKIKEKLEAEIEKKKEENEKILKDLNLIKEEQKFKQIEYEKELLKKNQELKEQFEKEKKDIISTKDREIQILREDKDREIQRLKEDKDREIDLLKKDMQNQMKKKDITIKKKEKVIEKQKKETKELKKDLTTGTFYSNNIISTLRQNNFDYIYKKEEKLESPQVVVSISSIFTDQELNAMDFEESCQFDKRNLCQVYLSFINRKQPLFFFFNYNSSSSGISVFQINFQTVRFIIICVDLMIYMFLYCTFFGTKSINYIYLGKFNFRRMCILGIIISPFCLIFRSIIHHFVYDPMNKRIAEIKMRCYTNFTVGKKKEELKVNEFKEFWESDGGNEPKNKEEIEKKEEQDDIQEIENDENISEGEKARRKDKLEKMRLKQLIQEIIALFKKKILISFCIMIVAMFFEWMYISSFCAVYKNSQLKFFESILVCYAFSNLIPFVYCLVPTILKQDAVRDESKYSFFLAKVSQII